MLHRHRDWTVPVVCFAGAVVTALAAGSDWTQEVEEKAAPVAAALPLSADEPTKRVGDLLPNESKQVKYTITNTSSEVLYLAQISKSCTCIDAAFEKARLDPGESTRIITVLKAGQQLGKLTASLDVLFYLSRDQKLQRLTLLAVGRVCSIMETEPDELVVDLGDSPADRERECVIIVSSMREPSTKVIGAHCIHSGVRVVSVSTNQNKRAEIRVQLDRDKFYIPVTKTQLLLYLDSPLQDRHSVDVVVRKQP